MGGTYPYSYVSLLTAGLSRVPSLLNYWTTMIEDRREFDQNSMTPFFDWVPDWADARDYKLMNFYDYLRAQNMMTTLTVHDKKTDLSISAYLDTRKTDLTKQHDGAAREVAYAAAITYSSPNHVLIPINVNYKLLYQKTINRMLNTDLDPTNSTTTYPVPIREVLKTLYYHGLENIISHWKLIFYNLEHSLDAVRISLINGYPVVFGFVVSQEIFHVDEEKMRGEDSCSDGKGYGSMVGCIVGFSENTFKIHVSDRRLFCKDPTQMQTTAFEFDSFLYLTEKYLKSNMCNDFYSIVGIHEPPTFQLLADPPEQSTDSNDFDS